MQERKKFLNFIVIIPLSVLLGLCVLGILLDNASESVTEARNQIIEQWRSVSWFDIPYEEKAREEDHVIIWQDSGMEAHIRFLLDKPEGDIYRKDVQDIHMLCIEPGYGHPGDTINKEADTVFRYEKLYQPETGWRTYSGTLFPEVESLVDLQYFDNLQVFRLFLTPKEGRKLDIDGIQFCKNLRVFQIQNTEPWSLTPLTSMEKLEYLGFQNCGTLDLAPLAQVKALRSLSLRKCHFTSAEPLSKLPQLIYLDMSGVQSLPDLNPLKTSRLSHLDISETEGHMNFEFLAEMPQLTCLSLSGICTLTYDHFKEIVSGCSSLQYLDISGTPAAQSKVWEANKTIVVVY